MRNFITIKPDLVCLLSPAAHLEVVEALAIDADDGALRDEGVRVDLVDELEDEVALAALAEHEEHLHVVAGVEAGGVDDGAAAMALLVDAVAYLLPAVADDEELNGAAHRVDHLVDAEGRDVEHDVAIEHLLEVAQHEVAARDDDDVADHDDASERHVAILVDDGGQDVGAARGAVAGQPQAHAAAAEDAADDGGHEGLVGQQVGVSVGGRQRKGHGEHGDGIDGLHAELPPQDAEGEEQQDGIDAEIGYLDGESRGPVEDRGQTGQSARSDIVRQQEDVPADAIAHHGDGNHHIVA